MIDWRHDSRLVGLDLDAPICFRLYVAHDQSRKWADFWTRAAAEGDAALHKSNGVVTCVTPIYLKQLNFAERNRILDKFEAAMEDGSADGAVDYHRALPRWRTCGGAKKKTVGANKAHEAHPAP